jgi:AbrB family transcriptional regulator (stage V sporulation protein T)
MAAKTGLAAHSPKRRPAGGPAPGGRRRRRWASLLLQWAERAGGVIWDKWVKWDEVWDMPLAKIDDRGRVQLPSNLRRKMKLKEGDEFAVEDLGEDTIILKRIDLRALLNDAIEKAKSVDLDELEREIEEESNQLARQKFKVSPR